MSLHLFEISSNRSLLDEIGPEGFSVLPSYPQIFPIFWGLG